MLNAKKRTNDTFFIKKWGKNNDSFKMKWDEYPEVVKQKIISLFLITIPFFLWVVFGIFTFNWVLYLGIIIFMLITNLLSIFAIRFNLNGLLLIHNLVYYFIMIVFCIFVVINSFHLQIDFKQLIF
ncbi:MAG: hypothetical protein ACOCVF_02745 [bacterium]